MGDGFAPAVDKNEQPLKYIFALSSSLWKKDK